MQLKFSNDVNEIQMKELSQAVYITEEQVVKLNHKNIQFLKTKALQNEHKRSRFCAHINSDNPVHEMIIVHLKNTYIPPHKHTNKSESFHIIEGSADILLFDEMGNITQLIKMGEYTSGKTFYYRIPDGIYHTLIITSDIFIFHETTKGPFRRVDTQLAPWAPPVNDTESVKRYMEKIKS